MGWMLFEMSPVAVWIACTGAMILGPGSFYFNEYLKLNGASEQYLAVIPLLYAVALILATLWNTRRRGADHPRHACLISCWWGRATWLLIILVPFLAIQPTLKLAIIAALILVSQTILVAGMGSWAAWTQRIVPNRHRPAFFAYRHLLATVLMLPLLGGLRLVWPLGEDAFGTLLWYQIVFGTAGLIALIGTIPLQLAPRMPEKTDQRQATTHLRLPVALRRASGVTAYCFWTFLTSAGVALATIYLPEALKDRGLSTSANLSLDIWLRAPATFVATLTTPWLAQRFGHLSLIVCTQVLTIITLACGLAWEQGQAILLYLCALADGCWRGMGAVVIIAYLQRLMPGPDRRLPSLFLAAGGLGQGVVAMIPLTLWSYFRNDSVAIESMCWLAMGAVGLGLPLLALSRARRKNTHSGG
jgi:predicted MFS family arabinose efflux permease